MLPKEFNLVKLRFNMEIIIKKIDFSTEVITAKDALYIEINGLQIRVKGSKIEVHSTNSLLIEPTSSNVVLIQEKE